MVPVIFKLRWTLRWYFRRLHVLLHFLSGVCGTTMVISIVCLPMSYLWASLRFIYFLAHCLKRAFLQLPDYRKFSRVNGFLTIILLSRAKLCAEEKWKSSINLISGACTSRQWFLGAFSWAINASEAAITPFWNVQYLWFSGEPAWSYSFCNRYSYKEITDVFKMTMQIKYLQKKHCATGARVWGRQLILPWSLQAAQLRYKRRLNCKRTCLMRKTEWPLVEDKPCWKPHLGFAHPAVRKDISMLIKNSAFQDTCRDPLARTFWQRKFKRSSYKWNLAAQNCE